MRWAVFTLTCLTGLFALYATAYWTWVCATPLTADQMGRARYNANCWLGITGMSLVCTVGSLSFALRKMR
ncbi:MAG: hypothetical protein JWO31_2539 [Phycisphaerales bacterium]|nr:hypothetical protein [Phycisphaerales bacterium]